MNSKRSQSLLSIGKKIVYDIPNGDRSCKAYTISLKIVLIVICLWLMTKITVNIEYLAKLFTSSTFDHSANDIC